MRKGLSSNKGFLPCICAGILWVCFAQISLAGEMSPGYPNHHLHNFSSVPEVSSHAIEMGYYFVATKKPAESKYEGLKLIKLHNANVGPVRVYCEKRTGKLYLRYHSYLERQSDNLNPLAAMHGLSRNNKTLYLINQEDLEIIKGYSAAKLDISDLTLENLTMELFREYFYAAWETDSGGWLSFNLKGNWQSKKVVDDMVAATTDDFPWEKYKAIFFDSFGASLNSRSTNADYGGQGSYKSWEEGKLDLVRRISEYARNTALTAQSAPYAVFANIYDPKRQSAYRTVLKWYAQGILRLDHYYYEKGGLEQQAPNGVVPSTSLPAYTDPKNPNEAYLPASKVSLDDVVGFNRSDFDGVDVYNRTQHFNQHLDACGTAGLYGAWFGWYGEDAVNLEHKGELIYTNDLQLLRSIPNWDNIARVPVPAYNQLSPEDQRAWDGHVYSSKNSYASSDVIWSRNPFNHELYVVFRSLVGKVALRPGEQVESAYFVNDWFGATDENALPALHIQRGSIRIRSEHRDKLNQGIRIIVSGSSVPLPPPALKISK